MMRPSDDIDHVWLAREPQDFRKGINRLSIVVEEHLRHDPFSGQLFVFINKAVTRSKCYTGSVRAFAFGTSVLRKSASNGPNILSGDVLTLDGQQLNWLLDGYDLAASRWKRVSDTTRPHRSLSYRSVL